LKSSIPFPLPALRFMLPLHAAGLDLPASGYFNPGSAPG
jgi:hypothetical protein